MTVPLSTLIGHLVEVRNGRLRGRLLGESEGFQPTLALEGKPLVVGQVGSYVCVRQFGYQLLAIIGHVEADSAQATGPAPRSAAGCLMDLAPLGEISEKTGFTQGIRRFPTPGAEIHMVSLSEVNLIFARNRRYGFAAGFLREHPTSHVYLNPTAMFSRHFAILGQSGSGKSWAVASLLQSAVRVMPRAHVILLDPHGEYCWYDDDQRLCSAFEPEAYRYLDARKMEIPYWLMSFQELLDLLIDRNDPGATIQTAFLRDTVLNLKNEAAQALGIDKASLDSPVYFSLRKVYDIFKDANEMRQDFGRTKGPLFGQFDEFLVKLLSRLNDMRYDFLLNPQRRNHSGSLAGLLRDFVGLGEPRCRITVIDLSHIPFDVRPVVSAQIGRLAFEFNYWNPLHRVFPILLICEEAHAYIPRETGTQYEGARRSMERIAKEGRKYGVGLGVVSQRPHEVSETVLSQCGTFVCLRITNPDDQIYVRQLVPEGESDLVDMLTSLGRGEAMVLGEAIPLPIRCQIFKPNPTPNSSDADFHTGWTEGPEDLDMDAIVDSWRRQGRR